MTELDEKALAAAKRAYDAKYADMSSPYPTEEPDAGGGPLGYAIMAYLDAIKSAAADKTLEALQEINSRPESFNATPHIDADEALVNFFREIRRNDIVEEWEKVEPKWYE